MKSYKNTIKLCDDKTVTRKPRTVSFAYQSKIFKQFDELQKKT